MIVKSNECLVEAAQNGDLKSFAALYQRYYCAIVALAYSILADHGLSEDAAQETFAIASGSIGNLKSKEKFGSWLAGICRNVAKQMRKSRPRHATLTEPLPAEKEDDHDDRCDLIRRAVWKLGSADRELIVLRYYNGMSYADMSALLGISQQAVNGRLIRAKRKIAKQLKRDGLTGGNYEM